MNMRECFLFNRDWLRHFTKVYKTRVPIYTRYYDSKSPEELEFSLK